ncbi:MAG: hypothetical protein H7Z18_10845 [Methylophilaceae bacterium]|nr:hypothetical protein [Methylophilaceae bacterium]
MQNLVRILFVVLGFFSQQVYAISTIQIQVGDIDAPAGKLKDAFFQVDLKGAQPNLQLKAEVKPTNSIDFLKFDLHCGRFGTDKIGQVDCENGLFTSKQIKAPFNIHFVSYPNDFAMDIDFNDASFSDDSGLHAGEKLTGQIKLSAKNKGEQWQWNGLISWNKGELFWQPFYFGKAGNTFEINGTFQQPMLNITKASLLVNEVGEMSASSRINVKTKAIEDIHVSAQNVDFAGLYSIFLKPLAEKSVFGSMEVSGKADWQFDIKNLHPTSFELNLRDANIEDTTGKFSFKHLNAHLPWDYDEIKTINLNYKSGYLLKIPLGATNLQAEVNRFSLVTPKMTLPILDGALNLEDVSAARLADNWVWHLRMTINPITMNEFSKSLGWPTMQGRISGAVPLVTYANKQLNMDGAMTFSVFRGTISMNNLKIDDPLGVVPRLYADLSMRNLDLGDLTRTFSFGAIEGKLDGDVNNMTLENWKPVNLDANIHTSTGAANEKQLKKISQRAVENITALGGEGTAAALQRTFLRFFKDFNYEKIGLSCKLRKYICEMGGVESTPTGYIIVKGQGIPSVNVNGYTQRVNLTDLLGRIKRITDSNTKVIVE